MNSSRRFISSSCSGGHSSNISSMVVAIATISPRMLRTNLVSPSFDRGKEITVSVMMTSAIRTYASAGPNLERHYCGKAPITFPMMFAVVYLSSKLGQRALLCHQVTPSRWIPWTALMGVQQQDASEQRLRQSRFNIAIGMFLSNAIVLLHSSRRRGVRGRVGCYPGQRAGEPDFDPPAAVTVAPALLAALVASCMRAAITNGLKERTAKML